MAAKPTTGLIRTPELPEPRDVVEGALYFVGPGSSEAPLQMFIGDAPYKLKPIGSTGIKSGYTHRQNTLSQVWTVNHNLGYRPAVSVLLDFRDLTDKLQDKWPLPFYPTRTT